MKRMKKMRMLSLVLIAILMVGSLAGCTGGSESADGMMALFLACVPPLVVFTLFQRQIMGGLNIGGVKG